MRGDAPSQREAGSTEIEREELRRSVVEGCRAMASEYQRIERDWEPAADEVWRALHRTPPSGSRPA